MYNYTCVAMSEDNDCRILARKYFDVIYNSAFRELLGSVTEAEYEIVKKPEVFDINMDYNQYIETIEKGAPEHEIEDTIDKIVEFLNEYVEFKEEVYGELLTGMATFISENTDQVKQNIAKNTDFFNNSSLNEESSDLSSEHEESLSENDESSSKKLKMMTGTSDISSEKRGLQISSENEERGVFKCRISGKDIEVETHGNMMLTQLYGVLFMSFCMLHNMTMEDVLSDRPKVYKSPLNEQSSDEIFSLLLDKIE